MPPIKKWALLAYNGVLSFASLFVYSLHRGLLTFSMSMQYQESFRLTNGHPLGVTCLSFSPDKTLLASGGFEGNICVWDMKTKKLVASSAPVGKQGVGVLSCLWKEGRNNSFVCGIQDGSIAEVTLTSVSKILQIVYIYAHLFQL